MNIEFNIKHGWYEENIKTHENKTKFSLGFWIALTRDNMAPKHLLTVITS